jgi:hypothetical protein
MIDRLMLDGGHTGNANSSIPVDPRDYLSLLKTTGILRREPMKYLEEI